MGRVEKTVFISYRRANAAWALAIYQNLTHHGLDVFIDFTGIESGDFERVILENIRSRAHFLVVLTPSALDRVNEPGDWLRREIEFALEQRRNIVPLRFEGFEFGAPAIQEKLTGKLALLGSYQSPTVPVEFFEEAMQRLRTRRLNVALDTVVHPASAHAVTAARDQSRAAEAVPRVEADELAAGVWFEKGYVAVDLDDKVQCYTEAIHLKPDFSEAYNNRGIARRDSGDLEGAIEDFDEAIRLRPDNAEAYNNRGVARNDSGDVNGAIADFHEAIRLKPNNPEAFSNRGMVRRGKSDLDGAMKDFEEALRLKPDHAEAYSNRGNARLDKGDLDGAIQDLNEAIRLKPNYAPAYNNRGAVLRETGEVTSAIKDLNEALRLKPNYAEAYSNRGNARGDKGDLDGAIGSASAPRDRSAA